jgi:hypothetical protein
MSVRISSLRRTTVPVAATLAMLLLTPSAAVADKPLRDPEGCALLLARAAIWPGGFQEENGTRRLVSDAYVSYLSAQPPCSSPEG